MIVKKFTANGKEHEIRLSSGEGGIKVRAFTGGQPANGYCYHVAFETEQDLKILAGQDAVNELVRIAADDVVQQKYEGLLKALKMLKT